MTVNPSGSTHFRVIHSTDTEDSLADLGQDETVLVVEEAELLTPETSQTDIEILGAAALPLPAGEELKAATMGLMQPAGKTDSPSKRKGIQQLLQPSIIVNNLFPVKLTALSKK